jgi:hypothetical protein
MSIEHIMNDNRRKSTEHCVPLLRPPVQAVEREVSAVASLLIDGAYQAA